MPWVAACANFWGRVLNFIGKEPVEATGCKSEVETSLIGDGASVYFGARDRLDVFEDVKVFAVHGDACLELVDEIHTSL